MLIASYYRYCQRRNAGNIEYPVTVLFQALTGIIHCQIMQEQLDEAQQQLEFLKEIQSTIGKPSQVLYLNALYAMKKDKPAEEVMTLLQDTVENHFSALSGIPLGSKYFEMLNPDFLLQVSRDMCVCVCVCVCECLYGCVCECR